MARFVWIATPVKRRLIGHRCAHDFYRAHELLQEAENPFDLGEDCWPVPESLRRFPNEHILRRGNLLVYYWQHPDGEIAVHDFIELEG